MREIKFRVWNLAEKLFVTDRTLFMPVGGVEPLDGMTLMDEESFVIQQFTGIKDKNGKEVYEGDIIKYSYRPYYLGGTENGIGEVFFDEACAVYLFDRACEYDFMIPNLHFEVIGNFCENPELCRN